MKKNTTVPTGTEADELPALPDAALRDEFAGRGGSYMYDPAHGVRVRAGEVIQRTAAEGVTGNE